MKTPDGKLTALQSGDMCVWDKRNSTISFCRGPETLRSMNGDVRYEVPAKDLPQLSRIVRVIAEVANLSAALTTDTGDHAVYRLM